MAKIAKELGILTIAVVTKPFSFEGAQRSKIAEQGIEELKKCVDAIIIVPNDRLMAIVSKDTTMKSAFALCDDVLRQAVEGISDLITTPGIINIDFADIKAVVENAGTALMGIGRATGEKRAEEAAKSPSIPLFLKFQSMAQKEFFFQSPGATTLHYLKCRKPQKSLPNQLIQTQKLSSERFTPTN